MTDRIDRALRSLTDPEMRRARKLREPEPSAEMPAIRERLVTVPEFSTTADLAIEAFRRLGEQ